MADEHEDETHPPIDDTLMRVQGFRSRVLGAINLISLGKPESALRVLQSAMLVDDLIADRLDGVDDSSADVVDARDATAELRASLPERMTLADDWLHEDPSGYWYGIASLRSASGETEAVEYWGGTAAGATEAMRKSIAYVAEYGKQSSTLVTD